MTVMRKSQNRSSILDTTKNELLGAQNLKLPENEANIKSKKNTIYSKRNCFMYISRSQNIVSLTNLIKILKKRDYLNV